MNNGSWLYATGFLLPLLSSSLFIFHSSLPSPFPGWSLSGEGIIILHFAEVRAVERYC